MPDLNGVQITIVCNDQPLEEYGVTCEGDTVTCWIPSEAGKVRAQKSTQSLSIVRSSEGGSSAMQNIDCALCFRPSRFDGEFIPDYPYTTLTEFSTATWTGGG